MKIGILTYHRSQNYGALLQATALQYYLQSLGHDAAFVDYWPDYHVKLYDAFSWSIFKSLCLSQKCIYLLKAIFTYPRVRLRKKKTQAYINNYLKLFKDKNYDVVIYGSDQIWRKQHQPTFHYFNPVYFGNGYVHATKKIAYAASMGQIEIDTQEDYDFIETNLKNFYAISLREKNLADRLKNDFDVDYPVVCDPVFLLSKKQWENLINQDLRPNYKYILYYRLQSLPTTDRLVEDLEKKTGFRVIEMRSYMPFLHYGERYRFTADPQEFISLLSGAEYVVTSSFHGISFSIIFNKQFFFSSQQKRIGRISSLLQTLGLEYKFNENGRNYVDLSSPIDYTIVQTALDEFVNTSRQWLIDQLQ